MSAPPATGAVPGTVRQRSFLASGGWVVVVAALLVTVVLAVHVATLVGARRRAVGDGRNPASYRFALQPRRGSGGSIVASGMPRDGLPALDAPPTWSLAELDADAGRRRLLLGGDPVIGVRLGGQARAYPLRMLVWHEAVNDTLGGQPILVAHCPLVGSAVVALRQSGATFAWSGLLVGSSSLLYRRGAAVGGESLWSPLALAAVSGPDATAGAALEPLHCEVVAWRDWRAANTDTTVLAPDPRLAGEYRRDPYASYLGNDELRFPVAREWPAAHGPRKTPVVAVRLDGRWAVFPFPVVAAHADSGGTWRATIGGRELVLRITDRPAAVTTAVSSGEAAPTVYAYAFAWWAAHPDDSDWVW
jgi:hypothetical protein